jgi:hypothetical protein
MKEQTKSKSTHYSSYTLCYMDNIWPFITTQIWYQNEKRSASAKQEPVGLPDYCIGTKLKKHILRDGTSALGLAVPSTFNRLLQILNGA